MGDLRQYMHGWTEEHFLSVNYGGPAYLDDDELRLVCEIGYRAFTWAQDVSPFEENSYEDVRGFLPVRLEGR